jgi:hypothetical protein
MAPHNFGEMGIGQAGQAIYIIYHRRWYMFSINHLSIGVPNDLTHTQMYDKFNSHIMFYSRCTQNYQ